MTDDNPTLRHKGGPYISQGSSSCFNLKFYDQNGDLQGGLDYNREAQQFEFDGDAHASAVAFLAVLNTCWSSFVNQAVADTLEQLRAGDKPQPGAPPR